MANALQITNGPGKFGLMLSLFEGKRAQFTFKGIGKKEVVITGLDRALGTTQTFTVRGFIVQEDQYQYFEGHYYFAPQTDDISASPRMGLVKKI